MPRRVAILLFDDVEVLDFAAPFEVFSVAGRNLQPPPFDVYTFAQDSRTVIARNRLRVEPHYSFPTCPRPDLLVVPGGFGTRREQHNPALIEFLRQIAPACELVLSICTGSVLLGRAGLLDGLPATTHHQAYGLLAEAAPQTEIRKDIRFVDAGHIVTSAGISAGLDASLYCVQRLLGRELAAETAAYLEYSGHPLEDASPGLL